MVLMKTFLRFYDLLRFSWDGLRLISDFFEDTAHELKSLSVFWHFFSHLDFMLAQNLVRLRYAS